MTLFRKAIIVFYILLVTVLVAVPLLDGSGILKLKDGTSWLITQIAVATAVPVAIAALKTTDFFREDPNDVARLKRDHLEALAQKDKAHAEEMAAVKKADAEILAMEKKEKSKIARQLEDARNPPKTIAGTAISAEEFKRRYHDE